METNTHRESEKPSILTDLGITLSQYGNRITGSVNRDSKEIDSIYRAGLEEFNKNGKLSSETEKNLRQLRKRINKEYNV